MSMIEISEGDLPVVRTRQALIVLDLQNDLVSTGYLLPVDKPSDFLDKIVDLVPEFRRSGNVIWVRTQFEIHRPFNEGGASGERVITDAELPSSSTGSGGSGRRRRLPSKNLIELYNKMLATNAEEDEEAGNVEADDAPEEPYDNETFLSLQLGTKPRCLLPLSLGSNYSQIIAQLIDLSKDLFFTKSHYSAFASGTLLQTLRGQFVTELFICGALTNISIFATAMDAARFGYAITIIEDCLGYRSKARHDEAIRQLVETAGCEIMTSSELIEAIKAKESAQSRPSNARKSHRSTRDHRNLPQRMMDLKLKNDTGKEPATADSPSKAPNSKESTPPKAESGSSQGFIQSIPAPLDDSLPEKPILPKKLEVDSKKRVPNKIKTRRRLSKSSSNDVEQPVPDFNKPSSSEPSKITKAPLSPTQTTLISAAEALKKKPTTPPCDRKDTAASVMTQKVSPHTSSEHNGQHTSSVDADKESIMPDKEDIESKESSTDIIHSVDLTKHEGPGLDSESPTEDEDFAICEGDTMIFHNILPDQAKGIFEMVRDEVRWQKMSHQGGDVPRLVAVQGVIGEDGSIPIYRHPADESPPLLPFTPTVSIIRSEVEKRLGHKVNHCLIQFYRNGTDYISEHSDKTLDIVPESFIANVSLGALRVMTFRTKKPTTVLHAFNGNDATPRISCKAPLPHNSMCKLGLRTNMRWLHGIRQDKRRAAEKSEPELAYDVGRISLTFRLIGTFLDRDQIKIWGQGAVATKKEDARSIINGETPQAEKMLWAFGKENQSSEFNWQEAYGEGFDVLHISNTRKLILSGDVVADTRVRFMLTECGLSWVVGELSPLFNWKGGNTAVTAPEIPEAFPVRLVDNDLSRARVQGDIAILLYLDASYGPGQKIKSQIQRARQYTRLLDTDSLLKNWRAERFDVKPFRRLLALWDIFAAEDLFISGPQPSVADYAFWPVLHEIVEEWGDGIESPSLQAYYDRMSKRESVRKLLGLSES